MASYRENSASRIRGAWRNLIFWSRSLWEERWRTEGPTDLVPAVRHRLEELDPPLPLTQIFTGADLYDSMANERRVTTTLFGLFALVALSLVAMGTYGVMAFSVRQRSHETGVRVALGARRGKVVRLILSHSLRLALVGIALGVIGTAVASDVIGSLLFGVAALNPIFLVGAVLFLLLVALSAAALPALRAVQIDPVDVMRVG